MVTKDDSRLALCQVGGLLVDLIQKLNGAQGLFWLDALKKMLRRENPWEFLFPRRVLRKVDYHETVSFRNWLEKSLEEMECDYPQDILERIPGNFYHQFLHLFKVTPREMGIYDCVPFSQIVKRAAEHGFVPCMLEVLFVLRVDYKDQTPEDPQLHVALGPILTEELQESFVFSLTSTLGNFSITPTLVSFVSSEGGQGYKEILFDPDEPWIFSKKA